MKFFIFFALAFATVWAMDLYSPLIEVPVLGNEGRISRGQTATPGQFKYMVGLDFDFGNDDAGWCGGSLIGKTWVLTAAHCTVDANWVMVYLGSIIRECHEKVYNVSKTEFFAHPVFDGGMHKNDIAVIRIPETNASSNIGFVRIPNNDNDKYLGESAVVSGWGETVDHIQEFSDDLMYATLKVSPGNICFEEYGVIYNNDVHICVATPEKVSPCHGDSGDPFVLQEQNLQIGVMSYGDEKGCTNKVPVGFTRVSAYRLWILVRTGIHY